MPAARLASVRVSRPRTVGDPAAADLSANWRPALARRAAGGSG